MHAGMVHTLHEIHRVLKPDGDLLDLRPANANRHVDVDLPDVTLHVGEIDTSRTAPDHIASDEAIATCVADGLYTPLHEEIFELVTDLDTVDDLRTFGASLSSSVLPDAVIEQVHLLTTDEAPDSYTIRVRREMLIAHYRKR